MNKKKLIINKLTSRIEYLNSIDIPTKVKDFAKNLIVDISGVTLAGSNTNSSSIFYETAKDVYSSGNSKVLGKNDTLHPAGAAFVNGTSAHSLDFDDNCYAGVVHASAVVFPAVLSYAQHNGLSGQDLLRGFIVGLEIQFAVAKALSNSIYDKGWWTTSMLGSIGSTAGIVSLSRLNSEKVANALSISIAGIGAIRAVRGTDSKHYYCGKSAENGIIANTFALKGGTGPIDVFEDRNGLISVLNNGNFEYKHIKNIGKQFSILNPGVDIKKYPVCYASHSAVDAVNWILNSKKVLIDNIEKIICEVPPIIASNLTYNNPKSIKEAQFSLHYAIAAFLKFGSINLEHLNTKYIFDPKIKILMNKVEMKISEVSDFVNDNSKFCPEWTNVKVFTLEGNFFEKFMGFPIGSAKNPLTEKQVFNKFKSCINFSETKLETDLIYEQLMNIQKIKNCYDLF